MPLASSGSSNAASCTRRGVLLAALGASTVLTGCAGSTSRTSPRTEAGPADAVLARARSRTAAFASWVSAHGVHGEIGETGWPGSPEWTSFASQWLTTTLDAGLPVTAFASAPWWPADSPLAFYRCATPGGSDVNSAGLQAAPLEQALHQGRDLGIACAEGSFGIDEGDSAVWSNRASGQYGSAYTYPSAATLQYLAGRGHRRVRVAFAWERLQRSPGAGLDDAELSRLRGVVRDAHAHGLGVVLDLHNYGRYGDQATGRRRVLVLGSEQLPTASLADLWRRVAQALGTEPGLLGYDLMNEPHDLPGGAAGWEVTSRQAVQAIRTVDPSTPVHVEGYEWASAGNFASHHASPWIDDPYVVYSAHQYFDADGSGSYATSYADTRRAIAAS